MISQPKTDNRERTTDNSENVQQAVPFLMVSNIQTSLRFYTDGLGFRKTREWINRGKLAWCWLELGGAAIMLQEYGPNSDLTTAKLGQGISIGFQCKDALAIYHDASARGLTPRTPFVGNAMWVTILSDPDGYKLDFESPTTIPEETIYTP